MDRETSDAFRVQWLSKTRVDFFRIGHLKNALNEGQAVLVGKDGQEIDGECGAALLREMEAYAESVRPDRRESRDGGPYGGGGGAYGGGRYVGRGREASPGWRR